MPVSEGKKVKTKGIIRPIHRRAARLLLAGWTPQEVAKEVCVKPVVITAWKTHPTFQNLLVETEEKLHAMLDKEIISLRRNAFRALQEAITHEDLYHRRWAIDRILTSTVTQDMRDNINISVTAGSELSDAAKQKAKEFLSLATPSYGGGLTVPRPEAEA